VTIQDFSLSDGRSLRTWTSGRRGPLTLVYFPGTPAGVTPEQVLVDAAEAAGLALVSIARPGYPGSTRLPGRDVVSVVSDTTQVLEQLGGGDAVVLGWSGGGPHALACAAHLPGCRAVASLAGIGPADTDLDLDANMAPENVAELAAARAGESTLRPCLEQAAPGLTTLDTAAVIEAMGELLPPADRVALTPDRAEEFAASGREALAVGIDGWLDDDLAFVRPWGFSLADIAVPVAVWQGDEDTMVPIAHGRWFAEHVPTARTHLLPGDGHMSAGYDHMSEIVADLVALAEVCHE
jgi:pimeloyl-ACP methyl ester carboxylesterase